MKGVIAHWALAAVVVAGTVALAPAPAEAGCMMNVYVKNTGDYTVTVKNKDNKTGVKMQGGTWRALLRGRWMGSHSFRVSPGERKGDEYRADFACGKKRRFRVYYHCQDDDNPRVATDYHPGSTSWSTSQTVTILLKQCK